MTPKQRKRNATKLKKRFYFSYRPIVLKGNNAVYGKFCPATMLFLRYGWKSVNQNQGIPKVCAEEIIHPAKRVKRNFIKLIQPISLAALFSLQSVDGKKH